MFNTWTSCTNHDGQDGSLQLAYKISICSIPGLAAQIMVGNMSAEVYLLGEVMQAAFDIVLQDDRY